MQLSALLLTIVLSYLNRWLCLAVSGCAVLYTVTCNILQSLQDIVGEVGGSRDAVWLKHVQDNWRALIDTD